jgi:hypothetical protein
MRVGEAFEINQARGKVLTHRFLKWLIAGSTLVVLAAFAGGAFAGSAPAKPDVTAGFTTDGSVAPES